MRMIDFGAWPVSWGGVEEKAERILRKHGWKKDERQNDDLIAYHRGDRTIRISFLGYLLIDDDMDTDWFYRRFERLWIRSWNRDAVSCYPTSSPVAKDWQGMISLLAVKHARRQMDAWLHRSLYQGMTRWQDMLIARCRQIERLHPSIRSGEWENVIDRLESDSELIARRARLEFDFDGMYAGLETISTILTPLGAMLIGLKTLNGIPVETVGLAVTGISVLLAALAAIGRRFGP